MTHTLSLSDPALGCLEGYLALKIGGLPTGCPYMNNKRTNLRAGLRVMIGKGSAKEIEEEVALLALRERTDLASMIEEERKAFLVNHHIGIDCSGFVYYVLDKEVEQKKNKTLRSVLYFPHTKNPLRRLLTLFRPIENTNVKVFAHKKKFSSGTPEGCPARRYCNYCCHTKNWES
jgi:hypothetical protein